MVTLSEESRRMEEMMKMYGMGGMDASAFGGQQTLVLNAKHPLVQLFTAIRTGKRLQCSVSSSMIWL